MSAPDPVGTPLPPFTQSIRAAGQDQDLIWALATDGGNLDYARTRAIIEDSNSTLCDLARSSLKGKVIMRLLLLLFIAALVASVLGSSPAFGAKPIRSCPAEPSAYVLVDRDAWWDRTVLGFENEGISVYDDNGDFTEEFDQVAVELGFVDGADLEFFVRVTGWDTFDLNEDGFVCMKDRPDTPGNPDYFLGGVDNTSSAK